MADDALTARAPFGGLAISAAPGNGVRVAERGGLALATVHVRRGQITALTERVRARFGIELPPGPHRRVAGDVAFAGIAPEAWLASSEEDSNGFARSLEAAIGDLASVADQSSGYAVLRMTGPKLRETLAKILPLDLHPRVFLPGDVASTIASHVGATLWRLEDGADGSPVFEIAVFRSLAGSFWHCLASSAAEFGFARRETLSSGMPNQ
ncbi:MAG TPA: sarcosine oxidase subunit gamma family protein [Steroidobacteraceae bacterium]|jgi:heterotetrameric sarcosine oxidase gamma subunit|nr:sarcosine oxidase subunit gamma family protein [Steroidobacteraceae bacterium]